jgi:hypothetical protein
MDSLTKGLYYISDTTVNDLDGLSEKDKIKIEDMLKITSKYTSITTYHKNLMKSYINTVKQLEDSHRKHY